MNENTDVALDVLSFIDEITLLMQRIEGFTFTKESEEQYNALYVMVSTDVHINLTILPAPETVTRLVLVDKVVDKSNQKFTNVGAMLIVVYEDYIMLVLKKNSNTINSAREGNILVIECFDRAIHSNIDKKKTGVTLFSSQILSKYIVDNGTSVVSSFNILT